MATPNLKNMGIDALLNLRDEIDEWITKRRQEIEKQLERLASFGKGTMRAKRSRPAAGRAPHPLKGKKRPVKYRDPESGAGWAGVGALPRWLKEYETQGRSREEFAVADAESAPSARRKGVRKAGRKPARRTRKPATKGKRG